MKQLKFVSIRIFQPNNAIRKHTIDHTKVYVWRTTSLRALRYLFAPFFREHTRYLTVLFTVLHPRVTTEVQRWLRTVPLLILLDRVIAMKWLGISQLRTATTNNSKYLPLPLPLFEQGTSKDSFPLKYQQNNNGRQYHQYRSTGSRRRGGENTWLPYITRRVTNFGVNFGHIIGTEEWKWNGQAGMMMHAAVVLINVLHVCYICLISCLCRCVAVLMFAELIYYG